MFSIYFLMEYYKICHCFWKVYAGQTFSVHSSIYIYIELMRLYIHACLKQFVLTYGVIILTIADVFLFNKTIYLFAGGYGCIEADGGERPQRHGGTNGRLEVC